MIPFQLKIALVAVAALVLVGLGIKVCTSIYQRGWNDHVVVSEREKAAMKAANDQAIAIAEKELREDIAALVLEKEKLEHEVADLDRQADEDPAAHDGGIGPDSVRRLNAIR